MKIILKEDVRGLGYKYDIVTVKNGYGLNYLLPKGIAVIANESNVKMRDEDVRQASRKLEKLKGDAEALAAQLNAQSLRITAKVGDHGRLFGSITTGHVAEALAAKGIEVDRRRMAFNLDPKTLGSYTVVVDLHRDVKAEVAVEVIAE
jgi:large subunit ribosomal protein L9